LEHVLGLYVIACTVALYRFLYFIFWMTRGGSPFSIVGMFIITILMVIGQLVLAYYLGHQLKENRALLDTMLSLIITYTVLGAPFFCFMDV